jgi:hypothetical protein
MVPKAYRNKTYGMDAQQLTDELETITDRQNYITECIHNDLINTFTKEGYYKELNELAEKKRLVLQRRKMKLAETLGLW